MPLLRPTVIIIETFEEYAQRDRRRLVASGSTAHDHDAVSRSPVLLAFTADFVLALGRRVRNTSPNTFLRHSLAEITHATQPIGLIEAGRAVGFRGRRSKQIPPCADRRLQIPIASLAETRSPSGPRFPPTGAHEQPAPRGRHDHACGGRRPKPFTISAVALSAPPPLHVVGVCVNRICEVLSSALRPISASATP